MENHKSHRSGWLRAAVLGSNDAIVSTASLLAGVSATEASTRTIFVVGVSGLVAGSLSMAVGEFISVSSQRDAERADMEKEREELIRTPDAELQELAEIYRDRGLSEELAWEVARQLSEYDRFGSHLRDELGIDPKALAHPWQAAWISALSFAAFACLPILFVYLSPDFLRLQVLSVSTLASLVGLGILGARLGGARPGPAALRVAVGGGLALLASIVVGRLMA